MCSNVATLSLSVHSASKVRRRRTRAAARARRRAGPRAQCRCVEVNRQRPRTRGARACADRGIQVLGDADAAEGVAAGGANAVLEGVVAQGARTESGRSGGGACRRRVRCTQRQLCLAGSSVVGVQTEEEACRIQEAAATTMGHLVQAA